MLRMYHSLAVFAFPVQAQQNWLFFAQGCRREPQSQYDASTHAEDRHHRKFTNEYWEPTQFWRGHLSLKVTNEIRLCTVP